MRQELLDELVTAAQEVVNGADEINPNIGDRYYSVGYEDFGRLKAVVKAISDDACAQIDALRAQVAVERLCCSVCGRDFVVLSVLSIGCPVHGIVRGIDKAVAKAELERALGHPLYPEEVKP